MRSPLYSLLLLLIILLSGCSAERNTWTSKAFHNTTSHYNGYYYAREEIKKIEKTLLDGMQDDHYKILRLFPALDSTTAAGYDKEIQETIKMASLAIQRHPNSKWVDDSYLLVGKARLYSLDWGNAIQTFKFVNTKSKDPNARHAAIINLVRTFTEHKEYNNAQAAIDYLEKEKLNKENRKNFLLFKAYYFQEINNLDYMVRNLTQAEDLLKKKDRKGRVYFIVGQVYQTLGFESEAYQFYKKCISTHPPYELEFYARLYMAQVTEISRSRDVNAARKSFKKLLKDGKNRDFQDKIYYEMGLFELKQKNIREAITEFNRAIRLGKNKQIDGEAYLKLGEIYYDTLKQYSLSQAYYDSAINALPKDYTGYAQIKSRQEILNDFVKHLNTIALQDSLLSMAALDSVSLRNRVDSVLEAKKRLAERNASKKKRNNRVQIVSNTNNNIFNTGDDEAQPITQQPAGEWYFYNPSAKAVGQTEFKRVWGDVALEDNWRRSSRANAVALRRTTTNAAQAQQEEAKEDAGPPADPAVVEYNRVNAMIPRTEAQRTEALSKIESSYFAVGDIYNFKLFEHENAAIYYNKLLNRFPESEFAPEVLYRLYLLYKDQNPSLSEQFADQLKKTFPHSLFAKILINPNHVAEELQTVATQKELYRDAYSMFENGRFNAALKTTAEAKALGETTFIPQLELLEILIAGRTEDIAQYQYLLDEYSKRYADNPLADYAKNLLNASREFQKNQEKRKGIQYIRSLEEPHYFVIVYKKSENMGNAPASTLERFNHEFFREHKLKTSNLILNDDYIITMVSDLPGISTAIEYVRTFNDKVTSFAALRNHKFNNFVITKDNFDIFYRTKGLDEYLYFFEKNYPAEAH